MANTLGQEDNLVDQKYVNGFIVNDDTTEFTELLTQIELQENLPNMNPQKGVNDPNFLIIVDSQEPYAPYEPLVLGELPLIKDDYEIEFQNVQRINLQFQNRLDERMENQINTAYAPQIINRGDLETLKSFPKLQNEIEAIDEYAKTHYLTPEQVKILKQELVKNNFKDYKTTIEGVKERRNRPPGAPGGQPPGAPGGQADGGEVAVAVAGAGGGDDQDERIPQTGERPPKPDKGETEENDQRLYYNDYINGTPKINYNLSLNSNQYKLISEYYMKNHFLDSFFRGSSITNIYLRNKFISFFVENNEEGIQKLYELYNSIIKKSITVKKPNYFVDFLRSINASIKSFSNNSYFVYYDIIEQAYLFPKSPYQKEMFIRILIKVVSECRKILMKNLGLLYLIEVNNNIVVNEAKQEDYKLLKGLYVQQYSGYLIPGYTYTL